MRVNAKISFDMDQYDCMRMEPSRLITRLMHESNIQMNLTLVPCWLC